MLDAIRAEMDRGATTACGRSRWTWTASPGCTTTATNMIEDRRVPYEPMDSTAASTPARLRARRRLLGPPCGGRGTPGTTYASRRDEVDRLLAGQAARRRAAGRSPQLEDETRTVQDGMIEAAEAQALPGGSPPRRSRAPAMRFTDHDTARQAVVSLYAYGPARSFWRACSPPGSPPWCCPRRGSPTSSTRSGSTSPTCRGWCRRATWPPDRPDRGLYAEAPTVLHREYRPPGLVPQADAGDRPGDRPGRPVHAG